MDQRLDPKNADEQPGNLTVIPNFKLCENEIATRHSGVQTGESVHREDKSMDLGEKALFTGSPTSIDHPEHVTMPVWTMENNVTKW